MAAYVSEFFGIIGVDMVAPQTMAELIPYLLQVFIGMVLVLSVFKVISGIVQALLTAFRRL